ncbi:Uncharacterised protein [Vibrio cholerae]|nr:Uncharacterised protein [Vibrio cholerae]CSI88463.1 Uncharacterised protein [Vibrio cholerae]
MNPSCVNRTYCRLNIRISGEQQTHRIRLHFSRFGKKICTIHLWHTHIRDDDVDWVFLQIFQRISAVIEGHYVVIHPQHTVKRFQNIVFIIK